MNLKMLCELAFMPSISSTFRPRIHTMTHTNSTARIENLIERALAGFKQYADPANHVEVTIRPITGPAQRVLVFTVGMVCVVIGIPLAAILPILPVSPFAAVGLFCFARVSPRFANWLTLQPVFKIAMTVIYTRHEWPFRLLRTLLDGLAGGQLAYK